MATGPEARWLWNGEMRPDVVRRQLTAVRDKGYRSIVVWPWAGLEVPYLSREHLSCLVVACEVAEQIGLRLWLADDVNWPSGTAGGHLLATHPKYAQRALVCTSRWVSRRLPRTVLWRGEGEQLVVAVALDVAGGRRDLARALENGGHPVREPRVSRFGGHETQWEADEWEAEFRLPPGDWFVTIATVVRCRPLLPSALGTCWSGKTPGTLDVLNPVAVRAFADATLSHYSMALRRWLGETVEGIVTVPPGMLPPHPIEAPPGWRADAVPWLPDLPDLFREREGQPLTERLPYLLALLHEEDAEVGDHLASLTSIAAQRYAATYWPVLAERCRGRGLQLFAVDAKQLSALPAIPYTLKGDRKRSVPPAQIKAVQVQPPGNSPQEPVPPRTRPDRARAQERIPATAADRPGWQVLDVLLPEWHWRPWSLNLLPLDAPPLAGEARHDRFHVRGIFEADFIPPDAALVFEMGVVEAVAVNGRALPLDEGRPPAPEQVQFADEAARIVGLAGVVPLRVGVNHVEATVFLPSKERIAFFEGDVMGPLCLVGSFGLRDVESGYCLVRPVGALALGDWGAAGFPRYTGTATYRQSFVVPDLPVAAVPHLVVGAFDGDVSVELNNRPIGGPIRSPCFFDLGGALWPGANSVAVSVTNGLAARLAGNVSSGLASVRLEYRRP